MQSQILPYDPVKDHAAVTELFIEERKALYPHSILKRDIGSYVTSLFTKEDTFVCKNPHGQLIGFINFTTLDPHVLWCGLRYQGGSCSINYIAISSPYRRKQYGTLLLTEVLKSTFDVEHIDACTKGDNIAATRLFAKAGFLCAQETYPTLFTLHLTSKIRRKDQ